MTKPYTVTYYNSKIDPVFAYAATDTTSATDYATNAYAEAAYAEAVYDAANTANAAYDDFLAAYADAIEAANDNDFDAAYTDAVYNAANDFDAATTAYAIALGL